MNSRKKAVLVGMILGDAYLQKTGKQNARIRLEHSTFQNDYLLWKMSLFGQYFHKKLQRLFYVDSKKLIPTNISSILKDPLTLAVWFMDDGYYYHRDNMAYIYVP